MLFIFIIRGIRQQSNVVTVLGLIAELWANFKQTDKPMKSTYILTIKGGGGGGFRPIILEILILRYGLKGKARTRPNFFRVF